MWFTKAAYIVDDQPSCVGGWIWIVATVVHGADTYIDISVSHVHSEKAQQRTFV
jgi:hypothetical protein